MTNSADPDKLATDLDLHCLLRQGMSCLAREGLKRINSGRKHLLPTERKIFISSEDPFSGGGKT